MEKRDITLDPLCAEVARDIVKNRTCSVSYIQRKYELGFNRAGRIVVQLEEAGIINPASGTKPREIKITDVAELETLLQELGIE